MLHQSMKAERVSEGRNGSPHVFYVPGYQEGRKSALADAVSRSFKDSNFTRFSFAESDERSIPHDEKLGFVVGELREAKGAKVLICHSGGGKLARLAAHKLIRSHGEDPGNITIIEIACPERVRDAYRNFAFRVRPPHGEKPYDRIPAETPPAWAVSLPPEEREGAFPLPGVTIARLFHAADALVPLPSRAEHIAQGNGKKLRIVAGRQTDFVLDWPQIFPNPFWSRALKGKVPEKGVAAFLTHRIEDEEQAGKLARLIAGLGVA